MAVKRNVVAPYFKMQVPYWVVNDVIELNVAKVIIARINCDFTTVERNIKN